MPTTTGYPEHIYLIRHGEKPESATIPPLGVTSGGTNSITSLIARGWERAGALARLFDPTPGKRTKHLHRPTQLFSPDYGASTPNHRTCQTISGLAEKLTLSIGHVAKVGKEAIQIREVLASSSPTVLICWEHDHIPALASFIPTEAGTVIPSQWPNERFDVIWKFDLVKGSSPPAYRFTQMPQMLLDGDLSSVIEPASVTRASSPALGAA